MKVICHIILIKNKITIFLLNKESVDKMLLKNIFLETATGMHIVNVVLIMLVQCMRKMNSCLYTGGNSVQNKCIQINRKWVASMTIIIQGIIHLTVTFLSVIFWGNQYSSSWYILIGKIVNY